MVKFFEFKRFRKTSYDDEDNVEAEDEYVELNSDAAKTDNQVLVRPFTIEDFSDIKPILNAIRGRETVCLVNIRPLKDKDLIELKRAINKLKKTTDAIQGDIAGFGEDYICITPEWATIYRSPGEEPDME